MVQCVFVVCMQVTWPLKPFSAKKLRLDHLVLDQSPFLSPLHASCYMDEDAMGQIKRLARESGPKSLGYVVLQRYCAYVCCRWLRQLVD